MTLAMLWVLISHHKRADAVTDRGYCAGAYCAHPAGKKAVA